MKINNISFGAKVPKIKCKVKDTLTNQFVDVTFCDLDKYDSKDVQAIRRLNPNKFSYINNIVSSMNNRGSFDEYNTNSEICYHTLETDSGEILGICQTAKTKYKTQVEYLAANKDGRHKYVGQNILACLGQDLINSGGNTLEITYPVVSATDFYKKCGFEKENESSAMLMQGRKIFSFIKEAEEKTNSRLIDIKA